MRDLRNLTPSRVSKILADEPHSWRGQAGAGHPPRLDSTPEGDSVALATLVEGREVAAGDLALCVDSVVAQIGMME